MMRRKIPTAAVVIILLLIIGGCGTHGTMADKRENLASLPATESEALLGNENLSGENTVEVAVPKLEADKTSRTVAEKVDAGQDIVLLPGENDSAPGLSAHEQTTPAVREEAFTLYLTRDFGAEVLETRNVEIKPEYDLMEYMQEEWQVTTGFGGGFIKGINGLESVSASGECYDWFFYVNGKASQAGAQQYKPKTGDIIYWDYHQWASSSGYIEEPNDFPPK